VEFSFALILRWVFYRITSCIKFLTSADDNAQHANLLRNGYKISRAGRGITVRGHHDSAFKLTKHVNTIISYLISGHRKISLPTSQARHSTRK
jgi:hypothetical protein